ncbi:MFS general substrate transporter [Stereum hirsutum FP-91666 SS1]|uniref:MFS general substrate transporter n=1 Tax=Stereum hirsutum (strain FP-91666) TaxID=721885 RepID=UPI000440A66D|nr:MFS general substrate transporter [Stereum hirsutum FP-91666 SS1]EIM87230.1 MFS general substrate transporter [Stereum hirsutum FP-91666 SS1]
MQTPAISAVTSHTTTTRANDDIILVTWEENDPTNPMNWSKAKKWRTTILLCFMCLFIGLATAAFSSGIESMCEELGVATEVGRVGMFVFNASFAIVPMFLGPLSEFIGRNPIYLGCYALFTVWFIPIALAKNIATVIIARLLSGCFGAAGTTIIPGTLADIWSTEERGLPVALFSFVAVFGTVAAPLYSGFINETIGWRWIEWVQLIANGCLLVVELLFLRETRGALVLAKHAKKLRADTGDDRYRAPSELETQSLGELLHASTTRAFILLVREPVVFFFSLWLAFAWAIIFLFFSVIPLTFQNHHGWSQGVAGLPYISSIMGCFFAFAASVHQQKVYARIREQNGGVPSPEARLWWSRVGAILLPVSLFWFSWTQFASVHWIVPTLSLCPMVFSIYLIFDAVQNYLADGYGEYASSAISAQGFIRNMLAASFPLYSTQMFTNLGYQWGGTLCALIATVMIPLPVSFCSSSFSTISLSSSISLVICDRILTSVCFFSSFL